MNGTAPSQLEIALERAEAGEPGAVESFYRALLEATLVVPERKQAQPLTHQPDYPNDFMQLLGIAAGERTFIPAFSRAELLTEWSGQPFLHQSLAFDRLREKIPEGWWLVLNPGSETQKEFSPWELEQLKGGIESVPALVKELEQSDMVQTVEFEPLNESELDRLRGAVTEQAGRVPQIRRLFALREIGADLEGQRITAIVIGVEVDTVSPEELLEIEDRIRAAAEPTQIGAERIKFRSGHSLSSSLLLGIFHETHPFYVRKGSGFIEGFRRWMRG